MTKKEVILAVKFDPELQQTFIYPDTLKSVPECDRELYATCVWIEGRAARVQIISDEKIELPECQRIAIAFMTGRYSHWTFSLTDETPKWRRVK